MKFQGQKSIRSKNIDVLVKVGTLKSANPIYFQYILKNIESSIKWAVVMLITPNRVFAKNFENLLFSLIFYCSLLFANNRTMGFPKIDKGTLTTIFFFDFQILGIKTSMLTNF